jgi:C1A family cysteine protease
MHVMMRVQRNSWGGDWGEDGYIRIERGVGASGVSQEAATIVV